MDALFENADAVFRVVVFSILLGDPDCRCSCGSRSALSDNSASISCSTAEWDPVNEKFGALIPIYGTLVTLGDRACSSAFP